MSQQSAPRAHGASGDVQVSFSRDLGLFDASMIGIGAMVGAGIFVLTGIAAGEAGPGAILAFALNGVVTLLTALSYAELASAYPQAGGGYSYIRKAFPGPVGFASGWMLWFSYIVACALYALGFGAYFWEFIGTYFGGIEHAVVGAIGHHAAVVAMTVTISVLFIALNAAGTAVTGKAENVMTVGKVLILLVFIAFGLKAILAAPSESMQAFTPFLPRGMVAVVLAMGLTFIAFEGYDLIATVAEEIKNPEKTIPRATFIALGVAVGLYLLILFVCIGAIHPEDGSPSWQFMGHYQETAVVRAAHAFMPAFGVALIIFGGLLSTTSALNATILASSRVAFSMSRDRMLPPAVSRIHPLRRTPQVAIFVTGAIVLVMAVAFPIQVVGSAASLMFLLTFVLVNASLIALRRKDPGAERRYRVPFYPFTPLAAIALNLFLAVYQFEFDPRSWGITAVWIVAGLVIYAMFFEKAAEEEAPKVIEVEPAREAQAQRPDWRVLIPLHNPDTVESLIEFAAPIARAHEGEIVALAVVEVPRSLPIHEGMRFVHHKQPLLRKAQEVGRRLGVPVRPALRVAHRVSDGILRAAEKHHASLVVMGWKGWTSTRDRIFGEVTDQVLKYAPCDIVTLKLAGPKHVGRIVMPTAGGPHATLAAELVGHIAAANDVPVTVVNVVSPDADTERRAAAERWMEQTVAGTPLESHVEKRVIESKSIPAGLVRAAGDDALIVLGASREGVFSSVLVGDIPEKVARHARGPVAIVKRYEGRVKSLVRRAFG